MIHCIDLDDLTTSNEILRSTTTILHNFFILPFLEWQDLVNCLPILGCLCDCNSICLISFVNYPIDQKAFINSPSAVSYWEGQLLIEVSGKAKNKKHTVNSEHICDCFAFWLIKGGKCCCVFHLWSKKFCNSNANTRGSTSYQSNLSHRRSWAGEEIVVLVNI